jgi:hypothetical protein
MKQLIYFTLFPLLLFTCSLIVMAQEKIEISEDPPPMAAQFPVLKENGQAKVVYNKSKDEAISQTRQLLVFGKPFEGDSIGLVVRFTSAGKTVMKPKQMTLAIYPFTKDRTYVDNRTIKIFLEKKQILSSTSKFVRAHSDGRIILAALEQEIPYKEFVEMSEAKVVKMQIGPTELELTESHIQAFRDLLRTIEN